MITDIMKKSLKFPLNNFKDTVIFAAFLVLFSFLVSLGIYLTAPNMEHLSILNYVIILIFAIASFIVYLIMNGFIYRIYKSRDDVPEFNDFKTMLIQGLEVFVVSVVYDIIPFIFIYLGFYLTSSYVTIFGGILLLIIDLFIKPFAIANMVYNNNFKEAFDLNKIGSRIVYLGIIPYLCAVIFIFIIMAIVIAAFYILLTTCMVFAMLPLVILLTLIFLVIAAILYAYLIIFVNKAYQLLFI